MNDINRILIFVLLIGLLYALYKYQHIIFETEPKPKEIKSQKKIEHYGKVTSDNISQISIDTLQENSSGDSGISKLLDATNGGTLGSLFD